MYTYSEIICRIILFSEFCISLLFQTLNNLHKNGPGSLTWAVIISVILMSTSAVRHTDTSCCVVVIFLFLIRLVYWTFIIKTPCLNHGIRVHFTSCLNNFCLTHLKLRFTFGYNTPSSIILLRNSCSSPLLSVLSPLQTSLTNYFNLFLNKLLLFLLFVVFLRICSPVLPTQS